MNRKGVIYTPTQEKNWQQDYEQPPVMDKPRTKERPDLEVGAVHKIRIQKDNVPPTRIYSSTVLEVHDNYYLESVETVPKTKTREAQHRKMCFPKVDHKFGIGSCDLEGKEN